MNWLSGEYITCDLVGPLLRSRGGSFFAAIYTDLASRFIWIKVLTSKSDNYQAMQEVFQDAKARSRNSIRFFKTDKRIYAKHSLRHIQSAPGDSASNDIAERSIRTVMELTRTNLLHAGAPPTFWAECMCMVTHLWNTIATCPNPLNPSSMLSHTALLEGHQRKYDLSNLRAFGTKCFWMLTISKKGGKKLAVGPKAKLGVIMGYEDNMAAYRVYDPDRQIIHKIPFSQVITHEGHYYFRNGATWSAEEKESPESFIPTLEAIETPDEWRRFNFSDEQKQVLVDDFTATQDAFLFGNPTQEQPVGIMEGPPPLEDPPLVQQEDHEAHQAAPDHEAHQAAPDLLHEEKHASGDSDQGPPAGDPMRPQLFTRSGPVLRERRIINQLIPPKPVVTPKPQRSISRLPEMKSVAPLAPIIESPAKGPQAVWQPNAPVDRPNDPRKVWTQPTTPTAQLINANPATSDACEPTGAHMVECPHSSEVGEPLMEDDDDLINSSASSSTPSTSSGTPQGPFLDNSQGSHKGSYRGATGVPQRVPQSPPSVLQAEEKRPTASLRGAKAIPNDPRTKPVSIPPPKNRKEALQSPWWDGYLEAEHVEMASHARNKTWELHPRSKGAPGLPGPA